LRIASGLITFQTQSDVDVRWPLRIDNKDGLNFGTFVQIGSGIQPIHYLLDDQMRPQIVTFSILAWILKDIT
ncbi:uncharacterized protein METZ01_LOCUS333005, partial [marine metagenome]